MRSPRRWNALPPESPSALSRPPARRHRRARDRDRVVDLDRRGHVSLDQSEAGAAHDPGDRLGEEADRVRPDRVDSDARGARPGSHGRLQARCATRPTRRSSSSSSRASSPTRSSRSRRRSSEDIDVDRRSSRCCPARRSRPPSRRRRSRASSRARRSSIRSTDVQRIEKASREITSLLEEGVSITSEAPQYFYTRLGELKVEMLAAAGKDARARADNILKNAGGAGIAQADRRRHGHHQHQSRELDRDVRGRQQRYGRRSRRTSSRSSTPSSSSRSIRTAAAQRASSSVGCFHAKPSSRSFAGIDAAAVEDRLGELADRGLDRERRHRQPASGGAARGRARCAKSALRTEPVDEVDRPAVALVGRAPRRTRRRRRRGGSTTPTAGRCRSCRRRTA